MIIAQAVITDMAITDMVARAAYETNPVMTTSVTAGSAVVRGSYISDCCDNISDDCISDG